MTKFTQKYGPKTLVQYIKASIQKCGLKDMQEILKQHSMVAVQTI